MAGMEQLEIHSKSYIVRWVKVEEGHTISWSLQPHKKSINFGIVKHPGTGGSTSNLRLPNERNDSESSIPGMDPTSTTRSRRASSVRKDEVTAEDQLRAKGFIPIKWFGKCEADKVTIGTYDIQPGQGGMYGLVFDNTFSKTISKTATFVLLTYPTNAPPNSTHHNLHGAPGSMASVMGGAGLTRKPSSQNLGAQAGARDSVDSLHSHSAASDVPSLGGAGQGPSSTFFTGILHKRRRKRGQGYARRYFSLDFVSCTLSYYYNRSSSALRGAIPLSLAAIAADERRREISIDSGAEIWHLKAGNAKDFQEWTRALEIASNKARGNIPAEDQSGRPKGLHVRTSSLYQRPAEKLPSIEDMEWDQVESLVSRIVGSRDAVRRLVNSTNPSTARSTRPSISGRVDSSQSINEKRPFWKRKPTPTRKEVRSSSLSAASTLSTAGPGPFASGDSNGQRSDSIPEEPHIHKHCSALLRDLDVVIEDFSNLLTRSKRRRFPPVVRTEPVGRNSIDSTGTDEFYDAEGGDANDSQLLHVNRVSDEDGSPHSESEHDEEFVSGDEAESVTSDGSSAVVRMPDGLGLSKLFPPVPKSLAPLPLTSQVKRRKTIPAPTVMPPSLISFLRKNVGKDLSTISMPVSANEPTSALQRMAEGLEYAQLLDAAANNPDPSRRHLLVTAFAISSFSHNRAKERAIRKPFNPMLGETYELVRGQSEQPGNFRFIAEKVSHRPVKMACQADSESWSYSHSSVPIQKFWGKSAELITEGRIRVVLRFKDGQVEAYSWPVPTVFLRNVVMGEKYVEPVGSIAVHNERSGASAHVEYKGGKGMFSGRSEEVEVKLKDSSGSDTGLGLQGNWTQSLKLTEGGKARETVWEVGKLLPDAYGMTEFGATLNELTAVEKGKCSITDSRLRADQRACEEGDLDYAEELKAKIENRQRERRKIMENENRSWHPRFFERVDGTGEEEIWRLKCGKEGYWEAREKGEWDNVEDVLCVNEGLAG